MTDEGTLNGLIGTESVELGPKRKIVRYYLVTDDGERTSVVIIHESPFEQPTLKSLVGRRCLVKGNLKRGTFVVAYIKPE